MLQKLDLAAISEQIVSPYRPIPLVSLAPVEVTMFVCQGSKSWHRRVPHDAMWLVLEGVITLDSPTGKMVLNEGELAAVPRDVSHNAYSGMRSTVVLVEERLPDGRTNGRRSPPPPPDERGEISKVKFAVGVRRATPFEWLPGATVGSYAAHTTRLQGTGASYLTPAGSLQVLVYRGMLDYETPDEQGTLVGSQLLAVSPDTPLTLHSEHGATVLALARAGAPLPAPSGTTKSSPDSSPKGAAGR